VCGNFLCEGAENNNTCALDCAVTCGNSACESGESANNCPADCTATCGNAACEVGENNNNCLSDCAVLCGNAEVEAGEACDDGNVNANDGCSASCQFENALISGLLFIDSDDNQQQDSAEAGIQGVAITVVDSDGTRQVTSAEDGSFSISVRAGDVMYAIDESQLALEGLTVSSGTLSDTLNLAADQNFELLIPFTQSEDESDPVIETVSLVGRLASIDNGAGSLISTGRKLLAIRNRATNCSALSSSARKKTLKRANVLHASIREQVWFQLSNITQTSSSPDQCEESDHNETISSISGAGNSLYKLLRNRSMSGCSKQKNSSVVAKKQRRMLQKLTDDYAAWLRQVDAYPKTTQICN
jgi:cysteine-rich repeat protein